MMKKKIFSIIALVALMAVIFLPSVSAVNMTVTNFATGKQDLMFYSPNGTLLGIYNTSSPVIPIPSDMDVQVVIRPNTASSWINNPLLFFTDMTSLILSNFAPIFMILGMCAILLGMAHYGRRH